MSDAQAWATIAKVNGFSFLPGDSSAFNKGDSWAEKLESLSSGEAGNLVSYLAYGSGNRPKMDGLFVSLKSYILIEGLEFESNSNAAGIIEGSNNITIRDCDFDGQSSATHRTAFTARIKDTTPSFDIIIENCIAHDTVGVAPNFFGGGIKFNKQVFDSVIRNCIVYNNTEVGIQTFSSDDDFPNFNIVIQNNIVFNEIGFDGGNSGAGLRGINIGFRVRDSIVERNFIYDCSQFLIATDVLTNDNIIRNNILFSEQIATSQGMMLILATALGDNLNTTVYNNTLVSTIGTNSGIDFQTSSGAISSGHLIKNNIVFSDQTDFQLIRVSDITVSFTSDNNLLFNSGGGNIFFFGENVTSLANWRTISGQDANSIAQDPLLNDNFDIPTGSPAKDAGVTLTDVTDDFRRLGRPQGTAYDIGAMEFGSLSSLKSMSISGVNIN